MKKPNYFIIGAQKCGTTSLASYLSEHPNVYMTVPKEPHFFSTDLKKIRVAKSSNDYLSLYSDVHKSHLAVGEASTTYLYSLEAIKNIYEFNSSSKIIVMLRRPTDLFLSLHSHYVFKGVEPEEDPILAWNRSSIETQTMKTKSYIDQSLLDYRQILRLGEQMERLMKVFPIPQIKVIFFDDFVSSTQDVYEEVLSFLDLPSDGRTRFPKQNQRRKHRYKWMASSSQSIKSFYRRSSYYYQISRLKKHLNLVGGISFWEILLRFNVERTPSTQNDIPIYLKKEISRTLDRDIDLLGQLTNADLSKWKT